MQQQGAQTYGSLPRAQWRYLGAAGVGEHAAVLEDELRLHHTLFALAVGVAPPQRLQLYLAVDAGELTTLFQHSLHSTTAPVRDEYSNLGRR